MIRSLCLTGILFISIVSISLEAQEQRPNRIGLDQGLRRRALVININAKVMDGEQVVFEYEPQQRIAIPGNPVGIRLVGSNVVVAVQFTPYIRRQGNILVAQGQIWIESPGQGVSYYTSIQTIPMNFDEPLYFFPLGTSNSSIEIILTVNPYDEAAGAPENEE